MKTRRLVHLALSALVLLVVSALPLRPVNRPWQDALARYAPKLSPSGQVVVVSVGDASIGKLGTWPWDRGQTAQLFAAIGRSSPKVLAFDGWFPPHPAPGAGDSALADTLRSLDARGVKIILPFQFVFPAAPQEGDPTGEIPEGMRTSAFQLLNEKGRLDAEPLLRASGILSSDTLFQRWSQPSGFINAADDPEDGVVRRMLQAIRLQDEYFPSLVVATLAAYGDASLAETSLGPDAVRVRETAIPIDASASSPVRWLGFPPSVPTVEASDVMADPTAFAERFRGRIVLIGVTSVAALNRESGDFFRSPVAEHFPGVELWAVAIENALGGTVPVRPTWLRPWELLSGLLLASVLLLLLSRRGLNPAVWGVAAGGLFLALAIQLVLERTLSVQSAVDLPVLGLLAGLSGLWAFRPVRGPAPAPLGTLAPVGTVAGQSAIPGQTLGATRSGIEPGDGIQRVGRYEIVAELGRGAMGVVYKGYDRGLDRHAAIKVIHASRRLGEKGDETSERFAREARAIAALNHPSIVTIYESDRWEGSSYIAMEFLKGRSLEKVLKEHRLPWKALRQWGLQLMEGLAYAHAHEVVHRDVKPANVMVVESGRRVKLTDFGLARHNDSSLTQEGQVLGTPYYMAPEQIDGQVVDGRADQFSLGVMLYEMIARRRPFEGDDVRQIMLSILLHPHPRLSVLEGSDIPATAIPVVERMLAKKPEDRFPDLERAAEAWRAIQG